MLVELLQRAEDAFPPDMHDERPVLREVVRGFGEGGRRLAIGGQLDSLGATAAARNMPLRMRDTVSGAINDGHTITEI